MIKIICVEQQYLLFTTGFKCRQLKYLHPQCESDQHRHISMWKHVRHLLEVFQACMFVRLFDIPSLLCECRHMLAGFICACMSVRMFGCWRTSSLGWHIRKQSLLSASLVFACVEWSAVTSLRFSFRSSCVIQDLCGCFRTSVGPPGPLCPRTYVCTPGPLWVPQDLCRCSMTTVDAPRPL